MQRKSVVRAFIADQAPEETKKKKRSGSAEDDSAEESESDDQDDYINSEEERDMAAFKDDRPLDELYSNSEEEYEVVMRRGKQRRVRLVGSGGEEEESEAVPGETAAAAEERIRRRLEIDTGAFLAKCGPEAVKAKHKAMVTCAIEDLRHARGLKEKQKTTRPAKKDKDRSPLPSPKQERKWLTETIKAPFIAPRLTYETFSKMCVWDTLTKGFTECYGGEIHARKPFGQYLQLSGKTALKYRHEIDRVHGREIIARDLQTILDVLPGEDEGAPGKKRSAASRQDTVLQQLLRVAGTATVLEFYPGPPNHTYTGFLYLAVPGRLIKPTHAYVVKVELPQTSDQHDYAPKRACYIVTREVMKFMVATHCVVMIHAFIMRSYKISTWITNHRTEIGTGTVTVAQIERELSPAFAELWNDWTRIRAEFCGMFCRRV